MPKPKTVTVSKSKLGNPVTKYVTVYLRVCKRHKENVYSADTFREWKFILLESDCCRIIPYKLKIPRPK